MKRTAKEEGKKLNTYLEDIQLLSDFLDVFGYINDNMQIQTMLSYSREIEKRIKEREQEIKEKRKVTLCLYGFAGFFFTIILL